MDLLNGSAQATALVTVSGNTAEWAGVLITGALLLWTHLAWRKERQHVHELETKEEERNRRHTASQVTAWVQRITPALREDAALPTEDYDVGSWALCIANKTSFGLYDWHVRGTIGPPEISVDEGSETHGPIGPEGVVVVSLPRLDPAASPVVELELAYRDEAGSTWMRGEGGLNEVEEWGEALEALASARTAATA